jgi:hypothetical protein
MGAIYCLSCIPAQFNFYQRDLVPGWLSNSNGISTDLVSGLDLLIHVLWLQSCNQDSDALSVLQLAQDEYFQTVSNGCWSDLDNPK